MIHKQTSVSSRTKLKLGRSDSKTINVALNKSLLITGIYFLFGCIWVILTDYLTSTVYGGPAAALDVSIIKGLFFIALTSVLFFCLIYPAIDKLVRLQTSLQKSNRELERSNKELSIEIEKRKKY